MPQGPFMNQGQPVEAYHINGEGNFLVATGAGLWFGGSINTPAASALATVYDGVDNTGTVLAEIGMNILGVWNFPNPVRFAKGLFIVVSGASGADATCFYNPPPGS